MVWYNQAEARAWLDSPLGKLAVARPHAAAPTAGELDAALADGRAAEGEDAASAAAAARRLLLSLGDAEAIAVVASLRRAGHQLSAS